MKRNLYFLLVICLISLWSSCRKDFEFSASSGNLEFSQDTLYLDTIFTAIGSSTYNIKVYNKSDDDIIIPSVELALGEASQYRLNVDGIPGKTFQDIELLANDSLFIFVESTVDITNFSATNGEFLYTDQIEFDGGGNLQKVELVTLIKDATFIFPDRDNATRIEETVNLGTEQDPARVVGRELLNDELTFTNEKPYVIYGFAVVPSGKKLTIEAGARIHFHDNSGIIVQSGASINVNGEYSADQDLLENEVIFEGDRLEPSFSDRPGQWSTIWLLEGSVNNSFNYATIKNALVGIFCDGNANASNNQLTINNNDKLTITNSQIYNSGSFGILGRNTSITAENVVINNAGQAALAATFGGKYNFTHSTITNYWQNGPRPLPALLINNFLRGVDEDGNEVDFIDDLSEANFNNCIIYGNDNPEFLLDESEGENTAFNFKFTNCLVRFDDRNDNFTGPNFDFDDTNLYENVIFNQDPDFKDPTLNMMMIGDDSAANGKANASFASQVPKDILDVNRTTSPDIGAYQHITFPEEDN